MTHQTAHQTKLFCHILPAALLAQFSVYTKWTQRRESSEPSTYRSEQNVRTDQFVALNFLFLLFNVVGHQVANPLTRKLSSQSFIHPQISFPPNSHTLMQFPVLYVTQGLRSCARL